MRRLSCGAGAGADAGSCRYHRPALLIVAERYEIADFDLAHFLGLSLQAKVGATQTLEVDEDPRATLHPHKRKRDKQ